VSVKRYRCISLLDPICLLHNVILGHVFPYLVALPINQDVGIIKISSESQRNYHSLWENFNFRNIELISERASRDVETDGTILTRRYELSSADG
jgi:hypothetical protein